MIGQRTCYAVADNVPFTSNIVPATVGLLSPLKALQQQHFRAWVRVTVGATGGIRLLIVAPAGATISGCTMQVNNTVAPLTASQNVSINVAALNALASAGTHNLLIEGTILNGAVDGSIDLQFAQDTSDALTMNVLAGSWMEVTQAQNAA